MPLRAEVLVGVDAGAGLVLLQGEVLVEVRAGDGAGVGGHHGVAPGSLLLPGHLGHVSNQTKCRIELLYFSTGQA